MTLSAKTRKSRFLKALAAANQNQAGFAKSLGKSRSHLSLVLNGKRESGALEEKIDAFIEKHLYKQTALAS